MMRNLLRAWLTMYCLAYSTGQAFALACYPDPIACLNGDRPAGLPSTIAPLPIAPIIASAREWQPLVQYFITNREPEKSSPPPGKPRIQSAFTNLASPYLRYGTILSTFPTARRIGAEPGESGTNVFAEITGSDPNYLPEHQFFAELAKYSQPGVNVYIHGYSDSFFHAHQTSAQLAQDLDTWSNTPSIFISWPANHGGGRFPNIRSFRAAMNQIRPTAELLQSVIEQLDGNSGPLFMITHSLGARLIYETLRLRASQGRHALRWATLVAAAPEVGVREFQQSYGRSMAQVSGSFLFCSPYDLALNLAQMSSPPAGQQRLGQCPQAGEISELVPIRIQPTTTILSLSNMSMEQLISGHAYFKKSSIALDILRRLSKRETMSEGAYSDITGTGRYRLSREQGYWSAAQCVGC